jgi:hypothetical protein
MLLLLMGLLLLGMSSVQLDFLVGGSVEKLFHAVQYSILWSQQLELGRKSWS